MSVDIRLIPKSEEWFNFYSSLCDELLSELDLPADLHGYVFDIWTECVLRVGRAPLPLIVDCVYVVAKLTGRRKSIRVIKKATDEVWGKRIDVLPLDRRKQKKRWVWEKKDLIQSSLDIDDETWNELVSEWHTDTGTEVIAPATYYTEGAE
tara:strand:- start:866 stop:1318 length:453 start_codon:yes stop_codon:yes gene_type:complete